MPYDYNGEPLTIPARSVVTLVVDLEGQERSLDVNVDGQVDVADVNLVINALLGKTTDAVTLQRADVTGDGTVDIADVNTIINAMLGK